MDYKKVLVLAVGGGNDSISTLLLQKQLNKTFGYKPEHIDIVAVLPDCLTYNNMTKTNHPLISIINNNTTRSVEGKLINAFPERILAQNKNIIPELNLVNVYGLSMEEGSFGISSSLKHLTDNHNYDLILSIDIGGDFIACEDNIEDLSPMMDGYMLYSLKELEKQKEKSEKSVDVQKAPEGVQLVHNASPDAGAHNSLRDELCETNCQPEHAASTDEQFARVSDQVWTDMRV